MICPVCNLRKREKKKNGFRKTCQRCRRPDRKGSKERLRDKLLSIFKNEDGSYQCKCGFIAIDECQMDINHKDGNHTNNAIVNLELICSNCHRLITKAEKHYANRYEKMGSSKTLLPTPTTELV